MEKIKVWKRAGFRLTLWDTGQTDSMGKSRLAYWFRDSGKMIFKDVDFFPGMGYAIDSMESVYSLLGFLSLQPGDTDSEYFEKYTPDQLTWCKSSRGELLRMFVNDFEEKRRR